MPAGTVNLVVTGEWHAGKWIQFRTTRGEESFVVVEVQPGGAVEGTVVAIRDDVAFVDIVRPLLRLSEEGLQSQDRPIRFTVSRRS